MVQWDLRFLVKRVKQETSWTKELVFIQISLLKSGGINLYQTNLLISWDIFSNFLRIFELKFKKEPSIC